MENHWRGAANYHLAKTPCQFEPLRKRRLLVGNEERLLSAHQCCQRSNFLAKSSGSGFIKRLATNLATFSGVFGFPAVLETNVKARFVLLP